MATGDIITLAEAKSFLNITGTASDTELADFISSASTMWVNKVGPVSGTPTYDEWYDGGGATIVLRHAPVLAITSITEAFTDSIAYTLTADPLDGTGTGGSYGYTLEKDRGLLVRRASGAAMPFAKGTRNVHVVYTAGYATVPADVKLAVQLLLKHMWTTQRAPGARSNTDSMTPGSGYMWPDRVTEIAQSQPNYTPGIA